MGRVWIADVINGSGSGGGGGEVAQYDYALLYNKIPAKVEMLPGTVVDAIEYELYFSTMHSNATALYNPYNPPTGKWELLGYIALNVSAVGFYRQKV